jgi:hypothetical protein
MSANLMVRPCSCPARDTLCSGGQMLSMSQMGQKAASAAPQRHFRFAPINGHQPTGAAGPFRARTGPHMPFYEESDATRAARLFRLAYGRRLRCLLKAHSGVGADAPEHDLVPVMAWRGFVPAHGSRDARYATIARRSCSSRLATTWAINGLHSPVRAPCWKS